MLSGLDRWTVDKTGKTLYYLSVVKEKLLNHKTIELVYSYQKKYTSKSSEK